MGFERHRFNVLLGGLDGLQRFRAGGFLNGDGGGIGLLTIADVVFELGEFVFGGLKGEVILARFDGGFDWILSDVEFGERYV